MQDTWEWDGLAWIQNTTAPQLAGGRGDFYYAGAAFDANLRRPLFWNAYDQTTSLTTTFEYGAPAGQ